MKNKEIEILRRKIRETKLVITFNSSAENIQMLEYYENKLQEHYNKR